MSLLEKRPQRADLDGDSGKALDAKAPQLVQHSAPGDLDIALSFDTSLGYRLRLSSMDVRAAVIRAFGREDEQALNLPIADAGLDSFDLVLLRTTLEKGVGCAVPDEEWIELASANDIIAYFEKAKDRSTSGPQPAGFGTSRRLEVNMPHMAIGGLSEHWLFKEMGDMHWNLI